PTAPNALTGKPATGTRYAPSTAAHAESVLRSFYDFHLEAGSGPMVNPFPLTRSQKPPQPDGATKPGADRALPSSGSAASASSDPRRALHRAVRCPVFAPGPGAC